MHQKSLLTLFILLITVTACDTSSPAVQSRLASNVTLKTVTLTVDKMTCAACPITVRIALKKVPGVITAKVSYKTKTAIVTFNPKVTTITALTKATGNAGYPSKLKE